MPETESEQPIAPQIIEVVMPAARIYRCGETDILVKPAPIGVMYEIRQEIARVVGRLIKEHPEVDFSKPQEHAQTLLEMGLDTIGSLFVRIFGLEEEAFKELPAYAVSEIIAAWVEVNRLPDLAGNLRRARQMMKQVAMV